MVDNISVFFFFKAQQRIPWNQKRLAWEDDRAAGELQHGGERSEHKKDSESEGGNDEVDSVDSGQNPKQPAWKSTPFFLEGKDLGVGSIKVIATWIKHNLPREDCDAIALGANRFGDEGIVALLDIIKHSAYFGIKKLDLHSCDLSPEGIALIAKAVGQSSITALDLSSTSGKKKNQLGKLGAFELSNCLQKNNKLTELRLGGMGSFGFDHFASHGVPHAVGLTTLDLTANHISNIAFIRLCRGLQGIGIQNLNLTRNRFSDKGSEALMQLLSHSTTLQRLNLSSCDIDISVGVKTDFIEHLSNALKTKECGLTHLILDDNPIGNAGTTANY